MSLKSKKGGELEMIEQNWSELLDKELEELEMIEQLQKQKIKELKKEGINSLDLFRLKKLDELQNSKNYKNYLEEELVLFYEQITGFKTLNQECERLSKRIEDIQLVVNKLRKFNKTHFENEKKLLDILNYVRELKIADIEAIKSEIYELDLLWEKWNYLKKEQIFKKIRDKEQVLSYIQNKSAVEIEKFKGFFKKLKTASRGKRSEEVYKELRIFPEFQKLKTIEIRGILSKVDAELKNGTPEDLEKSLLELKKKEDSILSEIEQGFSKLNLFPSILEKEK